ncbi:MAG: hypothetical protein QMD36_06600 [Candidatus Aenigmarchaeota archaeon]|nr:hypothetical protein [Candidatus Aenigmarchaeota archaeon]
MNLADVFSLECKLTQGSDCETGWTCVFSLNQEKNSHMGNCNYGTWKVCCKEPGRTLDSKVVKTVCGSNDGKVLTLDNIMLMMVFITSA